MRLYDIFDIVNLLTPVVLIYGIVIFALFFSRRIKTKSNQERLEFTSREIESAIKKIKSYPQFQGQSLLSLEYYEKVHEFIDEINSIYDILSIFNKIALAIEQGIYDENYVEITIGREMRIIHKKSLQVIRKMRHASGDDELFLAIELLLKEWDGNKEKYGRRVMKRGRYQ